jgi:hypothetical protein
MNRRLRLAAGIAILACLPLSSMAATSKCPTADDILIQSRLNKTAASGGGVVQLAARVYTSCTALIIPSGVHLKGAGRGATIIRGVKTTSKSNGVTAHNSRVYAAIGAVGATNFSVSELTIDNRTNPRNTNGITFIPAGKSIKATEAFDGNVCSNGSVERVEIIGAPNVDFHNYMIWNLRGEHISIVDNWIDGGPSLSPMQEGIESFGGRDVRINGNTVRGIGNACVNIGSAAGVANVETSGIVISNNYLHECTVGINLGTSTYRDLENSNIDTLIRGNVIINSRFNGIRVFVMPGTHERGLNISDNLIRAVNADGRESSAAGVWLFANGGVLANDAIVNNVIEGNQIDLVGGAQGAGIRLGGYPNVRLLRNSIANTSAEGVVALASDDIEISGNRIENAGSHGINVTATPTINRPVIERNSLLDWRGSSVGIAMFGAKYGAVRDNIFKRTDAITSGPISIVSSCGVAVSGNLTWYAVDWKNASTDPCK